MFVSVDKKKIFGVKSVIPVSVDNPSKGVLAYVLYGQVCDFEVLAERCIEIDNEYAIIANLDGVQCATRYAKEKGYIK